MGTIVDYKNIRKSKPNTENRVKSDPLELALNRIVVISNVEFGDTKYGKQVLLYTDLGTFRTTSERIIRDVEEVVLPALQEGSQVRLKIVRESYKNGHRGYAFDNADSNSGK